MTKKELDLLQFSSGQMAESHTYTAEILRSEVLDSNPTSRGFDNMPDCFRRDPFSSHLFQSVHSAKDWTPVGTGRISPGIHGALRPRRHWERWNMFSFPKPPARTKMSAIRMFRQLSPLRDCVACVCELRWDGNVQPK